MRNQTSENETAKIAWNMFEKTGDVGYYMLYCQLSREKKGRK